MPAPKISVVTPTFRRPEEVRGLLANLAEQTLKPWEVVLVDGASEDERETEKVIDELSKHDFGFKVVYIKRGGGTAIQRNIGIDAADGEFISFIDDDVRLERDFFAEIAKVFCSDESESIGGIVGYRVSSHFKLDETARWRWYKRLGLLTVFEPGRYDFKAGYPINNNLQPPFAGTRSVDFMTTACAVWRGRVFSDGLRFNEFFRDYGVLEDAHLSLRASRKWKLLQCGDAHCEELHSPNGRIDRRKYGYKCVVNYYFVFRDIAGPLSLNQKFRFWRYQCFELIRILASAIRRRNKSDLHDLQGRLKGMFIVFTGLEKSVKTNSPAFHAFNGENQPHK